MATGAYAQTTPNVVSGSFTEKVIAEIWLNKYVNSKLTRIAEFKVTPETKDFAFATPDDTAVYRLQVLLYKPGGRHPKLERTVVLPLSFRPGNNYTLKITPSKLDTVKKTGWALTKRTERSSFCFHQRKHYERNVVCSC